jgi:hypothetical protein
VVVTARAFGAVFISRDGGRHWTNITGNLPVASGATDPRLVPPIPWVSSVAVNSQDASEIWLGMGGIDVPHFWHSRLRGGTVTTRAIQVRLDDLEHKSGCNCRVEGVAASLQKRHAGL